MRSPRLNLLAMAVSALLGTACGRSLVRGGEVAEPGFEPEARVVASLVPSGCKDAAGKPVDPPASRVFLLQRGPERLIAEARGAQAVLLVHNSSPPGRGHFQVLLHPKRGGAVLVDYQVGNEQRRATRSYTVVREFRLVTDEGERFHAEYQSFVLRCELGPG